MASEAWQAIDQANEPPRIFRYGDTLAWLTDGADDQPAVDMLKLERVRHHLADVASFFRWVTTGKGASPPTTKDALPPEALAADLLCVPRTTLPRLTRMVRVPVFALDGRLLTEPGYDPASGLFVALPADLRVPPVPTRPSASELDEAVGWVTDELLEFPLHQ